VRKVKNIASEVDRKRTNRITLFFASSIGFPPFPVPGGKWSNINTRNQYVFLINSGQVMINGVNGKRITMVNGYDNVCGEQKCNSRFLMFISKVRRQAIQTGPGGIFPT